MAVEEQTETTAQTSKNTRTFALLEQFEALRAIRVGVCLDVVLLTNESKYNHF